jgi:outer membrane assembly lipoprotein YfiO
MPEALLLRADAKIMRKDFFKALYDLEYLVRAYPGSPQFMTALEREFEIARMFARGMKRKLWGMRLISAAGEAEELLIRIQERAPGSDLAERANMELGDYYYRRKEMGLAAEAYDIFLANFPRSLMATKAWQQQIDANLATVRGPRYDATGLYEARQRLGEFKEVYPAAAAEYNADQTLDDIAESLAAKTLIKADWYAGQERPRSAIFLYQRVVEEYPGTEAAEQAQAKLSTYGSEQVQRYSKLPPAVAAQLAEGQTVQPGADELETNAQPVEVEEVEIRPDDLLPTAPETE